MIIKKNWNILPSPEIEKIEALKQALNIDELISTLLVQRGIETFEDAKKFFRPDLNDLHDPFLMKDMDKAIERIQNAISNKQNIMIYGDYDVDGTTSVALLYGFLSEFVNEELLCFYIPDRYTEGYGISITGIDIAAEKNVSLIIALDCGIRSNEKVKYATEKNIDFIICDHHLPGEEIPAASAVLDPKRKDCNYPFKELSGCGIGYKLIQALNVSLQLNKDVTKWLDLVVTSIAADIVPITGENRILAFYGLQKINDSPRIGIQELLNVKKENAINKGNSITAEIKKEITISDIVFNVAPRINAAGRIEHGKKAVELLIAETEINALDIGKLINVNNNIRKDLDKQITAEALEIIETNEAIKNGNSTVLYKPDWHKGVVGIVASRVIEKYYKPTIILTESNGKATGSARSVKDFDVHAALEKCADLLEQFGGHKYAAGMTLKIENVSAFQKRFEEVVTSSIQEYQKTPVQEIDLEINLEQIDSKFNRILKQFSPFGPGNMSPVFLTRNLLDEGNLRIVGNNHLKLNMVDENGIGFPAIAFNLGEFFDPISKNIPVDICYSIEENNWKNNTSLQLNIKDIKA
jgi:single-stranded-DNA-specific exonuclease